MSADDLRRICRHARIWYDPEPCLWWMDDRDAIVARERIQCHPAAIHVTNAWLDFEIEFLEQLAGEAHWLEGGRRGWPESDERERARPVAAPENDRIGIRYVREWDIQPNRYVHRLNGPDRLEDQHLGIAIRCVKNYDPKASEIAFAAAMKTGDEHVPCVFCVHMVGDACRRRGCLRERYFAFVMAELPEGFDWFAPRAPEPVDDHELHRLADDGGPCHEDA